MQMVIMWQTFSALLLMKLMDLTKLEVFGNSVKTDLSLQQLNIWNQNHRLVTVQYSTLVLCIFQNGMLLKVKGDAFLFEQY